MIDRKKEPINITVKTADNCTVSNPDFYHTYVCHETNVSDALKGEVAYWNNRDPVMIDAPTGLGKTTFVYDVLLKDAKEKRKNVLILSNRISLSSQQKLAINEIQEGDLDVCLTEIGLQKQEDFGNVAVITYHRLPAFLHDPKKRDWIQNLLYVVADECHFFVADSLFNGLCDYYLKLLTSRFSHAVRIYLTATSWDVLYPLAEAEKANHLTFLPQYGWQPEREFVRYFFPPDYQGYEVKFFGRLGELVGLIRKGPDSKWLIFVDDKEKGKELLAELGPVAEYIDAENKFTQTWRDIVFHNQFRSQVLITTAVLDCGVNIIDDRVRNVAIMTDDRTSFMQMLGRKRRKAEETVDLWVQIPSAKKNEARLRDCERKLKWLERYDDPQVALASNRKLAHDLVSHADPGVLKLFKLLGGRLYRNELAHFYLLKRREHLRRLNQGDDFRECVYDWLGMVPEPDTVASVLKVFYESCEERPLSKEQEDSLRKIIVQANVDAGNKEPHQKRLETLGAEALSNRLSDLGLPYYIERSPEGWILKRKERTGELL